LRSSNPRKPLFIAAFCALVTYLVIGRVSPLDAWRHLSNLRGPAGHRSDRMADADGVGDIVNRFDRHWRGDSHTRAVGPSRGSAQTAFERRALAPFDGIVLKGNANVTITIDDQASVSVADDEDRIGRISTTVEGGKLVIQGVSRSGNVTIALPHLRSLQINGTGNTSLSGLRDPIAIAVSGPGNVKASGDVPSLDLVVTGPGDFELSQLQAEDAQIVLMGPGNAAVSARHKLNAVVLGSGHIRYLGDPQVTENVLGPGSVGRIGQG
jgi:hypothetical protein